MKWFGLLARVVVGGVWLVAGLLKVGDPAANVRAVRAFDLLPEAVVPVVGHALLVLEIVVGLCLLLGLVTRWAALVSSLMLLAFVVAVSSAWARGMSIECGCFGGGGGPSAGASAQYPWDIARDLGLLLLSAYLVLRPRTMASVDTWLLPAVPASGPPATGPALDGPTTGRRRSAQQAAEIRRAAAARDQRTRNRTITIAVLAAALAVVGVGYAIQSDEDTSGQGAAVPAHVLDGYAVAVGADQPKVVVDVYEDFMCPYCGQFEADSGDLAAKYAGRGVQFRYHILAFLDPASTTDYSTRAANALAVVLDTAGPQAAKRFHDALYAHQPEEGSAGLSDDQLIDLAVASGADRGRVERPIRQLAFQQWVRNGTDAASRAGVRQTPTVLVDGEPLPPEAIPTMVGDLQDRIGHELSR